MYEGFFVNDERNGEGKLTWKDGRMYEGTWVDGKQTGNGYFKDE